MFKVKALFERLLLGSDVGLKSKWTPGGSAMESVYAPVDRNDFGGFWGLESCFSNAILCCAYFHVSKIQIRHLNEGWSVV